MAAFITVFLRPLLDLRSRRSISSLSLFLVVSFLVFCAFAQVVHKKMHHTITWGPNADYESISVAISDIVYRLHQGYLSYGAVMGVFDQRLGVSTAPPGEVPHQQRVRDADYINETIRLARSLDTITIRPSKGPNDFTPIILHDLVPIQAEDVGRVDYYKLAFTLFGFKIQGMHYLFFTILYLSCLIYCLIFRNRLFATLILIVYLAAINFIVFTASFEEALPSISAYRAVPILAIAPILHLMMCVYYRIPFFSALTLAGALLQVLIFVFVVWSRSSAQWGMVALAMFTLLAWLLPGPWKTARAVPLWPFVSTVLAGYFGLNLYISQAVNPAYFTDELVVGHLVWHSAYIGLSLHPRWAQTVTGPAVGQVGDGLAWEPGTHYLRETRPDLVGWGALTNGYRFRLHDEAVRHLFLEFAAKNPLYMIELYLWWKPLKFIENYHLTMFSRFGWGPFFAIMSLVAIGAIFGANKLGDAWYAWSIGFLSISGSLMAGSWLPWMWAYSSPSVMIDATLTTTVFLMAFVWSLAGSIYRLRLGDQLRKVRRSRPHTS